MLSLQSRRRYLSPHHAPISYGISLQSFFSVVGGILAYAVVRDNDKSMAETCLVLGFLVLLVQLFLLFIR